MDLELRLFCWVHLVDFFKIYLKLKLLILIGLMEINKNALHWKCWILECFDLIVCFSDSIGCKCRKVSIGTLVYILRPCCLKLWLLMLKAVWDTHAQLRGDVICHGSKVQCLIQLQACHIVHMIQMTEKVTCYSTESCSSAEASTNQQMY